MSVSSEYGLYSQVKGLLFSSIFDKNAFPSQATTCAGYALDVTDETQVECYKKNSSFELDAAKVLLSKVNFNGSEAVLDAGCGPGAENYFVDKVASYHGIDISDAMIIHAKNNHCVSSKTDIKFTLDDISTFCSIEKYDLIFANFSLQFCDCLQALQNLYKSLKHGGKILINIPSANQTSCFFYESDFADKCEFWNKHHFSDYVNKQSCYSEQEFHNILTKAGYMVDNIEEKSHKVFFENKHDMADHLHTVSERAKFLAKKYDESTAQAFTSEFSIFYRNRNGSLTSVKPFLEHSYLMVIASKPLKS